MVKEISKVFFILSVLTVVTIFALELIFGQWVSHVLTSLSSENPRDRFTKRYYETVFTMCPDKYLHHTHCPEISFQTKLSSEDGGEIITSYINRSSIRVAGPDDIETKTDTSDFEIINIGDSHLQSREVFYADTLSRVLESATGKKVLQIGIGGWAPVSYYSWLKHHPLRQEVEVNMFVTPNDFLPNYGDTNMAHYRIGTVNKSGDLIFSDFSFVWSIFDNISLTSHLKHTLQMNSVLYSSFVCMRERLRETKPAQNTSSSRVFSDVLIKPIKDCTRINNYDDIVDRTRAHVRLSFEPNCWDEELREHVDSGVEELLKTIKILKEVEGSLRIFVAPPTFAFGDEGIYLKTRDMFKMSHNAAITTEPLVKYLTIALKDSSTEVISLEKVIREAKMTNKKKFFLLNNIHWTEEMHRYLGAWMAQNFYN